MTDKLKIAICDDDSESRAIIHAYLLQMLAKQIDNVEIFAFKDAHALINNYPLNLDILFLDIAMDGLNGMDAAKAIRKADQKVQIVFITNMPQFAVDGYKVHAFGFLLKPLTYESFQLEIWDLIKHIVSQKNSGLLIKSGETIHRVNFDSILYIETSGRILEVHTLTNSFPYKATISDLEKELSLHGIVRCHHSFLVNLSFVNDISTTEISLTNGIKIPLSRSKRVACLQALSKHLGCRI